MPKENLQLKQDILENYENFSAEHFSLKYGVSTSYIYYLGSKLKVSSNQRWEKYKNDIIFEYIHGKTLDYLGDKYGHDKTNMKKKLEKWGVKLRNSSECKQKYLFDFNFFKKIDTEEKAYWLGFIYADGNIYYNEKNYKSVFQIALAKVDKNHLLKLKKSMKIEHPLYKDKNSYRLMVNNIELCRDLENLGVNPNKSLNCTFPTPEQVPEHLIRHFIRGYFDGDGYISSGKNHRWKLSIIGTYDFILKIQDFFIKNGTSITNLRLEKRTGNNKLYYLTYSGSYKGKKNHKSNNNFDIIFSLLFVNSNISLDRKRIKMEKINYDRNRAFEI